MTAPRASIVVLNWNGLECVGECLDSLLCQTYADREIIVVDNGSDDGSLELLRDDYGDRLRLVETGENLGYAGGNNRGMKMAQGNWIGLVNNDVVADRRWLERMMAAIDADDRYGRLGMAASKVINYHYRSLLDNTGHLAYPDGLNRGRGRLRRDSGQYDGMGDALFPSGCAGLYRREMVERVGGFDEAFFAYGDDADLGLRGRLMGWMCIFVPEARVYHRYSASAGAYSTFKAYHVERNRVWVMLRNYPRSMIVKSPWHTLKRYVMQAWGALSGRGAAGRYVGEDGAWSLASTLLKSQWDAWKATPGVWRDRKKIWSRSTITEEEMEAIIDAHRIGAKEIALSD